MPWGVALIPPGLADGVTHWSLTGSQDGGKDTFLSFSDGVSQAGTASPSPAACRGPWVWVPAAQGPSRLPLPLQWSQRTWK